MKKYTFLLLGWLYTILTFAAASTSDITSPTFDKTHNTETICEDKTKPTFKTTNTGNEYLWYKLDVASNTYKHIETTTNNTYTPTQAGKYLCKVYTNGSTTSTGNLISAGTFNFQCNDMTRYDGADGIYIKDGITYRFKNLKCNANDGTYPGGFTCIKDKSTNVKPTYFQFVESQTNGSYDGTNILVCDGMNSSNFRVWEASGVKVQANNQYKFTCSIANIDKQYNDPTHGSASLPLLKFFIEYSDGTTEEILKFEAPTVVSNNNWKNWDKTFTPSRTDNNCTIYIQNYTTCDEGNDFALDNITFGTTFSTSGTEKLESFELKIDSKPTITMPTIADQCPNTSVEIKPTVLKVGSSPKYTWSGDATGNLINTTITSASNVNGLKKCSLRVDNGKCYTTADITIKTKNCGIEKPIPHPVQEACPGVEVELKCNTSITGAQSVKWEHDSSSGQSAKVNAGPNIDDKKDFKCTIVKIEGANTVTYIETFSILTINCTSKETETHNLSDCPKQEVTLTCTTTADATKDAIVWSHDATLKSTTAKVKTKDTPAAEGTPNTPDTYTCTITKVNDKGETFIYTETFNVTTRNDCVGDNNEKEELTIGSSVTIQSDYWNTTGAIFEWYKVVDGVNTPVPGDPDNPGKLTFKANESITYFCITTLPNGYVYTETRVIEVHNDTEKDVYICYNDDFSVTATTKDASEYKWYDTTNDTKVLSEIETLEIKELKQNTSYICRIIGADKITKITETYHVKVNPLPEFNVEVKVANVTVDITNGSAPYELSLSNGTTSTATSNEYTYEDLVEDTYTLSITDKNKCVYANEFTISIPKLEPMKFFSPNNDNLNDLWLVHGIETAPNAYIRIYDRHSKLLYQCKGSEFQGWDGKYETKDMVQDDYWYVISVPETEETLSGHFTLKR